MKRIVFAGGGTAGHIEPAIACATAWMKNHPMDEVHFLGTREGLENSLVPAAGFKLSHIAKVIVPRRVSFSLFVAPTTLTTAFLQARSALKSADLLIGFGGYVSAPAYLAAKSLGIPIVIHEANAKPGLANRLGAQFTPFTAVAQSVDHGKLKDALVTGLPLRRDVVTAVIASSDDWSAARIRAKRSLGFNTEHPVVFIFFGSQGSVKLNSVVAQALPDLLTNEVQIYHAVGKANPLPAENLSYRPVKYVDEMATAYLAADLVISRSGAVTCSEVNALGKFALFIPLPIGNGEQEVNARGLVSHSRAEVLNQNQFTPEWLTNNLERLLLSSQSKSANGSDSDLLASEKIIALMEFALSGGKS
jgi:UDP-N-acetylglucosamine--N-acetylmuramyl-(pentapeptide) pyrophosphoryl-undecaprenol N-acetylglucosamine transferase